MGNATDYHVLIPAAGCSRRLAHLTTDKPKSLLEIHGKCLVQHSLDVLERRNFSLVTFVVGYKRNLLMNTLGRRHGAMQIDYVVSQEFDRTEHGWSLYLTNCAWRRAPLPVIFMDADNLYEPALLDLVLDSPQNDVCLVDASLKNTEHEEELVLGKRHQVSGLKRGTWGKFPETIGGFVGINKFSVDFMTALYDFMDEFFATHDRQHKYERVFDAFIRETGIPLHYCLTNGLPWINVNHQADYDGASHIAKLMHENSDCGGPRTGSSPQYPRLC
jgi:choline kinase